MTRLDTTSERYDATTVWLHWITVALVVVLWVIGQTGDLFPRAAPHRSVVHARDVGLPHRICTFDSSCLVPQFGSGDAATRHSINEWHELAANLLIVVAAVHALAALGHHYVWRDRLLDRMRP
jgi:cytochrome b561